MLVIGITHRAYESGQDVGRLLRDPT